MTVLKRGRLMAKPATILLAVGVISVSTAPLAAAEHGTFQICVRNDAHVAGDTLAEARRVVSGIYSDVGVTLLWCSNDCTVTIALRPRASNDTARRANDAMGYTPGGGEERGRLAFVLINRVNEIADGYTAARSIVLGAAIAHELGHLLISKEHTNTGIMKAYLNQSDFRKVRTGKLRLTAEQTRHIRNSSARVATSEEVADNLLSTDAGLEIGPTVEPNLSSQCFGCTLPQFLQGLHKFEQVPGTSAISSRCQFFCHLAFRSQTMEVV
jgi:hypothetical protein